jgi:hypothetical protein
MRRILGGILAVSLVLCEMVFAGNSPKVIRAVRTEGPIVLDGLLHDWRWQAAPPVEDFTQFYPLEGGEPTERTSVRILYDDRALYVGVICYDSNPHGIVSQLTRRDRTSEADRFTVQIDSYHDHQTAFVFSVNVAGVQSDGFLSQDGNVYDLSYDAVWRVQTARHREGWSAEFVIPYNALRFSLQQDGRYEWGINFRRYISRKRETIEWVMVPSTERLLISKWGHLTGITNITPPLNVSFIPYVSGTASFESEAPGRPFRSDQAGNAGLDIKYGLSRNFTLDVAINPDFGQVEVDQAILNLTVFETFYPEKRPFFIEGASLFEFGTAVDNTPLALFYSRRIGQRPLGSYFVTAPRGGSVVSNPLVTTILGAAKVTGHSESGLSLGVLTTATAEENAVVKDSTGSEQKIRTEPRGTYNVVRLKQELGGSSWLGGIATLAARENVLPAYSGGLDWNLRFDDGMYTLDGYVAAVHSSTTRLNPDGGAGRVLFSKISAEHWFYTLSYNFATPRFNSNDLGFFNRPRHHGGYVQLLYRESKGEALFRQYAFSLVPETRWNWDGVRTLAQVEFTFSGDWTNFWLTTLKYTFNDHAYDDAERGIIGLYRRPVHHALQLGVQTDERQPVSAAVITQYKKDGKRKTGISTLVGITLRPTTFIELTPLAYFERTRDEETGVLSGGRIATQGGLSLFADRDVDEIDLALRGIVTFTRTLSLQFYTQILLARGRYHGYRVLLESDRFIGVAMPPNYDFNYAIFDANVLLRWEFLPGSTIYLVWTQNRFGDSGNFATDFGPRLRETFKLPHDDAVLLKLSYWIPL